MATDWVHTGDVVEAVLAVLRGADGALHTGGLPANWFADAADDDEVPLQILQHGDLADYAVPGDVLDQTPMILVRGLGTVPDRRAAGGAVDTIEPVRIIHIRRFADCRTATGTVERNMARARERYAKLIHAALWHDPHQRLAVIAADGTRTLPTITCADGSGAQVTGVSFAGWDLGYDAGSAYSVTEVARWRAIGAAREAWCIGCQIEVRVKSGP